MHAVLERLGQGPVVSDGAWGTQLQLAGLAPGEYPDAWNVTYPERVEAVARAYVEAGSEIILTNTFGANRLALAHRGLADQVVAINRAGVEISKRGAAGKAYVFASMGPSGRLLGMGQTTLAELRKVFGEQAQVLAEAGADGLVLETFSDLDEVAPALAAAKETGLPVVASMVFDSGKQRDRTMMGVTPERAAEALASGGADVIGANCGSGSAQHVPICERMREAIDHPLWLKPNAGLPELQDGRPVYRTTPEEFARDAMRLIQAGASFVGGCCGTSPDFVAAIARVVREARARTVYVQRGKRLEAR